MYIDDPIRGTARRSVVRTAVLPHVFNSNRERMLDAHIARLAVLYEDLRVETSAIKAHSIPCLDVLDPEHEHRDVPARIGSYRSHYFLRRSIGTLSEFADGLRLLTECEEFVLIKPGLCTRRAFRTPAALS
jgi:hypothetical protein